MPFDNARQNIFEDLLGRFGMERRDTVQKFVCNDPESPLCVNQLALEIQQTLTSMLPNRQPHHLLEGQE